MKWTRAYGAGPWHLVGLAVCFAIAAYAATRVMGTGILIGFAVWFIGAVILHDMVLWPLYSAADTVLRRGVVRTRPAGRRPAVVNHVRVPVALSGLLLLVWFPLVLGRSEANYRGAVGLSTSPYFARWLFVALALFVVSGVIYAVRWWAAGRSDR